VCGTVGYGFVGSECLLCVGGLVWVCGSECLLCVGQFFVGFWEVNFCCVWESFVWVFGSERVLCVGQYGVGFWECVCAMFGTVCWGLWN